MEVDFDRAARMDILHESLKKCGISKKVLAEYCDIPRTSLTNKFSSARTLMNFGEPTTRDYFSAENEEAVRAGIRQIILELEDGLRRAITDYPEE